MDALIVPALALIAFLLTPNPAPDRIVLLPNAQGGVGALIVKSAAGEQRLDQSYAAAEVTGGTIALKAEDAESVHKRYGATLAAQPDRPQSILLYFQPGSSTELTEESRVALAGLPELLGKYAVPELLVIGHTDRVGSVQANDGLSLRRAESVRRMIVDAGIQASAIDVAGRGEREPLVETADEVAEAKNRRVEINIR